MAEIFLKIRSDLDCEVWIDDELITVAKKEKTEKIPLKAGVYFVQLKNPINNSFVITYEEVRLEISDILLKPNFIELIESHPEQIRDEDLAFSKEEHCYKNLLTEKSITPHIYNQHYNGMRFHSGLSLVMRNGMYGFIDKNGREVIPCVYEVERHPNQNCCLAKKGRYYGIFEKRTGKEIIPFVYEMIEPFDKQWGSDTYRVRKNVLWGLVKLNGEVLCPCIYNYIDVLEEGLACVEKDNKRGYINEFGKVIIPCIFDIAYSFENGCAVAEKNDLWGVIDKKGNIIIPFLYNHIEECDGYYWLSHNGLWGLLDNMGKIILPFDIQEVLRCGRNVKIKKNGLWGFYTMTGKEIISIEYEEIKGYKDKFLVKKNGLWGIVNETGIEIHPFIFEEIESFRYDYLKVKKNGLWGIINNKLDFVIPCDYEEVRYYYFGEGYLVCKSGLWGFINEEGIIVQPFLYEDIKYQSGIWACCKINGLWGVVGKNG